MGGDKVVFVWDVATGQVMKSFTGHHAVLEGLIQRVNAVAWNPDCNMLLSGSADGTMRFWDMRQKKMLESDVVWLHSDLQALQGLGHADNSRFV